MKEPQNITYLFGAGASCQALPVVNRISKELEHFSGILRSHTFNGQSEGTPNEQIKEELLQTLAEILVGIEDFGTIDGYARQLWLNKKFSQLIKFKAAISLYFTVRQLGPPGIFMVDDRNFFQQIDRRYYPLLAKYMNQGNSGPVLPSNINVLTWNYDFQIELALMKIHNLEYASEVFDIVDIIPDLTHKNLLRGQILHLNGIAGAYNVESGMYSHIYNRHSKSAEFGDIIEKCIFVYQSAVRESISFQQTFAFAWENSAVSQLAITNAKQILSATDIFVIIGYSFPDYNRDVDRELINSMNLNASSKMVFYQDPGATEIDLVEMFDLLEFEPSYRTDCSKFLIPPGY